MNDPVLALSGIDKTYNPGRPNAVHVLRGLSITLNPGEIVALVAPSGAGKSTLLHICGLLDTPDAGDITLAGTPLSNASDAVRTRARQTDIGFIYQFHHLLPEFSAVENVTLPQRAAAVPAEQARERAETLLTKVGLAHRLHHRPADLSGGEQQRVAFCRALANGPKLLLADEPTGNLDPETSDALFSTLVSLVRDTGLAALIATHNLELAGRMDKTFRLSGGHLE